MNKLLGFTVKREKHPGEHTVWTGQSFEGREAHKAWILCNVSDVEYDGVTTFTDVESPIVITATGLQTIGGKLLDVVKLDERHALAYVMKKTKAGRLKRGRSCWLWLNGEAW